MTSSKGGQPTKYDPLYPNILIAEGLDGDAPWTDVQIAARFGVCIDTVRIWKKRYPAFKAACSLCKQRANAVLESTAFQVAQDRPVVDIDTIETKDAEGTVLGTRTVTRQRTVSADTQILKLLLMNRLPEKYRDVQKVEHSGTLTWVDIARNGAADPSGSSPSRPA
ncbi:MAG: helix-turn-helix domain-containing protein [bacterium]